MNRVAAILLTAAASAAARPITVSIKTGPEELAVFTKADVAADVNQFELMTEIAAHFEQYGINVQPINLDSLSVGSAAALITFVTAKEFDPLTAINLVGADCFDSTVPVIEHTVDPTTVVFQTSSSSDDLGRIVLSAGLGALIGRMTR